MSFGVPSSLLPPVSWRPRPLVLIRLRCNFLSQEGEAKPQIPVGRLDLRGLGASYAAVVIRDAMP